MPLTAIRIFGRRLKAASGSTRAAMLVFMLAAPCGCATTVTPPVGIEEPARVALLDHGRHATLLVETPSGNMIRYAYGEWGWYALRDAGIAEGSRALLWPTQGALGRRSLPGPLTPEQARRAVSAVFEDAIFMEAEAAKRDRLIARLDAIFLENIDTLTFNAAWDLAFVHHPAPYSAWRNSNHAVARWLEELRAGVDGLAYFSIWERGAPGS